MGHDWIIRNTLELYCGGTLGQYAGGMASGSLERCSSYKTKVSAFLQLGWHIPTAMGGIGMLRVARLMPESEVEVEGESTIMNVLKL